MRKPRVRKPVVGNRPPADIDAEVRRIGKLNPTVVEAIKEFMQQDRGMMRPPEQAARLLALIVKLNESHEPFPHRQVAAKIVGGSESVWTVDNAIRNALSDGYATLVVETTNGHVASRDVSVRKQRFLLPSKEIKEIATSAAR
jgi:hypothetical protein